MRIRLIKKSIFIVTLSLIYASCYYDSEEELYPTCNIGSNISYTSQVLPILNSSCMTCHNKAAQNGGVNLDGHGQVKIYVTNGKFIGSIKHLSGYSQMPSGSAKLSDCNIAKIEKWIAEGALNN